MLNNERRKNMKQIKDEPKRKQKNPTTNYAKDTHKQFCERCFAYNKGCPDTESQRKSNTCAL